MYCMQRANKLRQLAGHGGAVAALINGLALAPPAMAGQYEALCGGTKCSVRVTPVEISSPFGSIPPKRVTYWAALGDSKTSVGTGVATTILFGGIGLLGFLAKNHQYDFTVNGYDASGKQVSMQFRFANDKPAKLLIQEMIMVTGLGMGQTRTVEEIRSAESGTQESPGIMKIHPIAPGAISPSATESISSHSERNCWSTYLANNPAMDQWAKANPSQAMQNKKRFDDC